MVYLNGDFVLLHYWIEWNFTIKSRECHVSLISSWKFLDIPTTSKCSFNPYRYLTWQKHKSWEIQTFSVIMIRLIWRLSTRNYHMRNETIDENTKNKQKLSKMKQLLIQWRIWWLFFLETNCHWLLIRLRVSVVRSFFMISC